MARESQFTKSMKQSYAVQNLDLEHKIPKHLISAATTIYTPDWAVR